MAATGVVGGRLGRGNAFRVFVAVIAGIVVGGLVGATVGSPETKFESRSVLLIDQPTAIASAGDEGVIVKLIRLRTKYADLLRTDPLSQPIADELGRPLGEVKANLRAQLPFQSLLLVIVGSGDDAEEAQALAQAAAESVQAFAAAEQEADQIPADERVVFEVVEAADPGVKAGESRSRRVTAALVSAVVAALAVLALLDGAARLRRQRQLQGVGAGRDDRLDS